VVAELPGCERSSVRFMLILHFWIGSSSGPEGRYQDTEHGFGGDLKGIRRRSQRLLAPRDGIGGWEIPRKTAASWWNCLDVGGEAEVTVLLVPRRMGRSGQFALFWETRHGQCQDQIRRWDPDQQHTRR
jgi:hypothetical protein